MAADRGRIAHSAEASSVVGVMGLSCRRLGERTGGGRRGGRGCTADAQHDRGVPADTPIVASQLAATIVAGRAVASWNGTLDSLADIQLRPTDLDASLPS